MPGPSHPFPHAANPDAGVPYEFHREIARGGMGSILEARDCRIGRIVAVKVMLSEMHADEHQKQRFINEAAVLGLLEHPNIVPIHDLGRDGEGQLYYTMKRVQGHTLQAILNDLRNEEKAAVAQYTLERLLTIFRKVCDALAFAHSRGIIHRDLKPENIMVGEFGEVLVMDWGLAKNLNAEVQAGGAAVNQTSPGVSIDETLVSSVTDSMRRAALRHATGEKNLGVTLEGEVMGTPQYMSPEQAQGHIAEMEARSDIFSLGGILYALLTLRPPVEGKTLDEVLQKVSLGDIAPFTNPSSAIPNPQSPVPPALAAVTMKALSVNKDKRYQTVDALSKDVESYQNGFATHAEQAGAWRQFTLLIKRHKAATIGVAAVLMIGTTLGTKALIEGRRAEREAAAAKATLADLRRTAPVFHTQAKVDFEEGKFEAAIEKIGYAIQLDDANADYHLFLANLRQSSQDLSAAAAGYSRVLALRPADAAAKTNLALCETLLRETGGAPPGRPQQHQLLAALREQKRLVEAAPLATLIDPDIKLATAAILSRLREARKQPGWGDYNVSALPDGTFKINLGRFTPIDFSVLKGQPVSVLILQSTGIADLGSLAGLPLKELDLQDAQAPDLSPLRGMKLQWLNLNNAKAVSDLRPLAGMPLTFLDCTRCPQVSDLSALHGAPLAELKCSNTAVFSLTPLAGMPLTTLDCTGCRQVSDLSPLRGAPLEDLRVGNANVSSLAPLAGAPLKRLNVQGTKIADLVPLSQCAGLKELDLEGTPVADLTPLANLHLTKVLCGRSRITSIAPLRGQPLRVLDLTTTSVTDLSPLAGCDTLEEIVVPVAASDLSMLRHLPRLKLISTRSINSSFFLQPAQAAEEFWKDYDAKKAAGGGG